MTKRNLVTFFENDIIDMLRKTKLKDLVNDDQDIELEFDEIVSYDDLGDMDKRVILKVKWGEEE
jgi:hypothetical protein